MKLDQVKNLGKELSKKELKEVKGEGTAYYQCEDGRTGQIRNVNSKEEFFALEHPCGPGNGEMYMNL
ncbi:hypothetical protein [uncultured Tenacibaculum sp.]|uniref:hypothetical protein n=1 Tax=uncultured Tenacibaculum sp. TaxID=174713 RepID=UPI00261999B1|nr:hypothetical protein [uncultured Tenacibaculum sp.]